jgi:hypothetical protein
MPGAAASGTVGSMVAIRSGFVLVLIAVALAAVPGSAGARSRYCGSYSGNSSIYALKVTCRTAYHVIRNFGCVVSNVRPFSCRSTGRSGGYSCTRPGITIGSAIRIWTCRKRSFVVSWYPGPSPPINGVVRG